MTKAKESAIINSQIHRAPCKNQIENHEKNDSPGEDQITLISGDLYLKRPDSFFPRRKAAGVACGKAGFRVGQKQAVE